MEASNSFWVYSLDSRKWSRIYTCHYNPAEMANLRANVPLEPCPRYAHQFVYDEVEKVLIIIAQFQLSKRIDFC